MNLPVFECDKCGACCRHLIVEIDELDLAREPRLIPVTKPFAPHCGQRYEDNDGEPMAPLVPSHPFGGMLTCGKTFVCGMLGRDNQCMIYPTRPNVCVAFRAGSEQCQMAREQAEHYGLRFETVKRGNRDLLEEIRRRGKWPSSTVRYCTSYYKRDQVKKLMTQLVRERGCKQSQSVSILNCLGFRAQESRARAKRLPFSFNRKASNGKRVVYDWLPIHDWPESQVWKTIEQSQVRYHPAYDLGMPRLSCCFCIFAPKAALMIAGQANPQLLAEYVRVEEEIGHSFRVGRPGQVDGIWDM